jgi:hypothetical protein
MINRVRTDQRGITTVEYVVLMVCVLGSCYAGWRLFGERIVQTIAGS